LELDRGEERRALPSLLGHAFDHAFARFIERDHLDHARLGIGIIDPEPRLGGGAHARAFAVHGRILLTHAAVRSTGLGSPARAIEVASSPIRRQRGMIWETWKDRRNESYLHQRREVGHARPRTRVRAHQRYENLDHLGLHERSPEGARRRRWRRPRHFDRRGDRRPHWARQGGRRQPRRSRPLRHWRRGAQRPDSASPEALKRALIAAKSVAHSKTGMSGIYFPTVLARLGIADAMKGKIVIPDPGTPVGEVVAKGDAEIGIQQISELLPVAGVEIVGPLPDALQKITIFSAGVLAAAKEPDVAAALLKFVAVESPRLLKQKGLEPA